MSQKVKILKKNEGIYLSREEYTKLFNAGKQTMKVSFDFHNTLDTKQMQDICRKFINIGAEVWVVTSRATKVINKLVDNSDLFKVTDNLNISRERIIFTSYEDKAKFVKDMDLHFDDNVEEIFNINQFPSKTLGLLYEAKFDNNGIKDW